ncbi:MAG: hypothetical protein KJ884_19110 [Gammaproteobacteria bacterium]|jgi:hypothetical protein|nr:hypothetical protein [Gammaproteobacteria bacterium]MBU1491484.1 hypothetical protein [Gammaproteobacteria bacterium]MBU2066210.1 hypothetical protein [Gammaproteobacteria bacterium]MBU2139892.1 hypothetical protein [Gammaproteobacteria bacterium]MBU2215547.1 hypothetical protein [Gammaproteobacteria bacterium]
MLMFIILLAVLVSVLLAMLGSALLMGNALCESHYLNDLDDARSAEPESTPNSAWQDNALPG